MINLITELSSNNNPVINGAISIMLGGAALYFLKELPMKIYYIFLEQFTTTVNITNYNISYYHLQRYFMKNDLTKYSRILTLNNFVSGHYNHNRGNLQIGPGRNGLHLIKMLNKLMMVRVIRSDSHSDREKEEIIITYLGRSQKYIKELVELLKKESEKTNDPDKIKLYKYGDHWYENGFEYKRPISSIILDDDIINSITKHIEDFMRNKEAYTKLGKPYRTCILLHGQPGTGKTSLIKALASKYEKDLCVINPSKAEDLDNCLNEVPQNAFIVIEDVDSLRGSNKRKKKETDLFDRMDSNKTSGLLNAIDGIGSYTDSVLFMTTNHLKKLDPALLRKGRADLIIEIKSPSVDTLRQKVSQNENDLKEIKNMKGCDLQEWILQKNINDLYGDV